MSADWHGNYLGVDDALDADADDDSEPCSWRDGEPWAQECDIPLECWCLGKGGHCPACNDTGLAKFQTVW